MEKLKRIWSGLKMMALAVVLVIMPVLAVSPAFTSSVMAKTCYSNDGSEITVGKKESCPDGSSTIKTNILPTDMGIKGLLKLGLNVLVYGLGAAAVLGVIICGIQYMSARDNEAQVAAAKKRLYEVVIGLVAWALLYSALKWLIPGFDSSIL